jgi:hypothetical protein
VINDPQDTWRTADGAAADHRARPKPHIKTDELTHREWRGVGGRR